MENKMSECWKKIGNISGLRLPQELLDLPKVVTPEVFHNVISDQLGHCDFWLVSTKWASYSVINRGAAARYLESLGLPKIAKGDNVAIARLMTTAQHGPCGWHVDPKRTAAVNISIGNSNTARTEWEDGTSYIMEDGDVYSLDVTKQHRIVFFKQSDEPRTIISITLEHSYNSPETQQMLNNLQTALEQRNHAQ